MFSVLVESGNSPMSKDHYFHLTDRETEAEGDWMRSYRRGQIGGVFKEPQFEPNAVHFYCDILSLSWALTSMC